MTERFFLCIYKKKYINVFNFTKNLFIFVVIGDRPSSQMSFLEQFLKESSVGRSRDPLNSTASGSNSGRPERVSMDSSSAGEFLISGKKNVFIFFPVK